MVKACIEIPLEPDIPKTAITTPFSLFEFVCTFGLHNAGGQTFQNFIAEVIFPAVFTYSDDILMPGPL